MNPSSVCFVLNLANIFLTVIMVLIAFKIIPIKEGRQKDAIMVLLSFSVILSSVVQIMLQESFWNWFLILTMGILGTISLLSLAGISIEVNITKRKIE
jgi:hypothetical protein